MYLGEVVIYGPVLFLHAIGSAGCVQNFPVSKAEVIFSFGSASVNIFLISISIPAISLVVNF